MEDEQGISMCLMDRIKKHSQFQSFMSKIAKVEEQEEEEKKNSWVQSITSAIATATAGTTSTVAELAKSTAALLQMMNPLMANHPQAPLNMQPPNTHLLPGWTPQQGPPPPGTAPTGQPPQYALTYPGYEPAPGCITHATQNHMQPYQGTAAAGGTCLCPPHFGGRHSYQDVNPLSPFNTGLQPMTDAGAHQLLQQQQALNEAARLRQQLQEDRARQQQVLRQFEETEHRLRTKLHGQNLHMQQLQEERDLLHHSSKRDKELRQQQEYATRLHEDKVRQLSKQLEAERGRTPSKSRSRTPGGMRRRLYQPDLQAGEPATPCKGHRSLPLLGSPTLEDPRAPRRAATTHFPTMPLGSGDSSTAHMPIGSGEDNTMTGSGSQASSDIWNGAPQAAAERANSREGIHTHTHTHTHFPPVCCTQSQTCKRKQCVEDLCACVPTTTCATHQCVRVTTRSRHHHRYQCRMMTCTTWTTQHGSETRSSASATGSCRGEQ